MAEDVVFDQVADALRRLFGSALGGGIVAVSDCGPRIPRFLARVGKADIGKGAELHPHAPAVRAARVAQIERPGAGRRQQRKSLGGLVEIFSLAVVRLRLCGAHESIREQDDGHWRPLQTSG